jgi:serine/threonine protein phosphatase PrpC
MLLSAVTQVTKDKQAVVTQKKKQQPAQISLVNAYRQVADLNGFLDAKGSITTLLSDIPNLRVSDKFGQEIGTLRSGKSSEKAFVIPKKACGVTTSTYPMITTGKDQKSLPIRYGDPNCDRFGIKVYKHRILVCVTDGCGWGERSCRASEVANHAFMNYIENQHVAVEDTHSAALLMLKGLQEAHEAIIQNVQNHWEAGTTTLCGGMLLRLEDDDEDGPRFGFLCANIGDCKAYLYNTDGPTQRSSVTIVSPKDREVLSAGPSSDFLPSTTPINLSSNTNNTNVSNTNGSAGKNPAKVIDMTRGNRGIDARHTGGCLGPKLEKLKPRLDNLKLTWTICRPKDLIVLVSDGVHDNFDPEALGEQPGSLGLNQSTWLNVPQKESIEARDKYRANRLHEQIEGFKDPKKVTDTIIRYVVKTTHNQREFLEKNKGGQVPDDFVNYPGKMDHCTCVSFVVG